MARIKMCTDIPQSKVLEKLLPLESADMWYEDSGLMIPRLGHIPKEHTNTEVPCWSLAALIKMLPKGFLLMDMQCEADLYSVWVPGFDNPHFWKDNPLDATFEMIVWLKENNKF